MRWWLAVTAFATALLGRGEIIDRIAVTVDRIVITESDIVNDMRIAAFQNGEPLQLTPGAKREAARRLVEQVLVRREMEISRYPAPAMHEIDPLLERLKAGRFANQEEFQEALDHYGLTEEELREGILLQLTVLRFVEFRFRPGITVTDDEVLEYYESKLVPESADQGAEPPDLEDSRDLIEEILIEQRVNKAVDRWLRQAAGEARVQYREEVFQ